MTKIESERLLFVKLNQKTLRGDMYTLLRDTINNNANSTELGQLLILHSTFTGSPRHMHQYAQETMTYVRNYGKPDFFLTFIILQVGQSRQN